MRAYWILPNRKQGDEVLASDGSKTFPLREVLDPALRPEGFSHGVPTEILEKCDPKSFSKILFGQVFPKWNGDERLVSISTTAGLDASGRVVHIGLLFFLAATERPTFDVPCDGLPTEDTKHAVALLRRLSTGAEKDAWVQSVRDLIESPPELGPATNIELERSVARFASLYTLGRRGLRRKRAAIGSRAATIVILIVVAFSATLFCLHGGRCPAAPRARPAGEPSVHLRQLSAAPPHPSREW